jgi:hypothetical protein
MGNFKPFRLLWNEEKKQIKQYCFVQNITDRKYNESLINSSQKELKT